MRVPENARAIGCGDGSEPARVRQRIGERGEFGGVRHIGIRKRDEPRIAQHRPALTAHHQWAERWNRRRPRIDVASVYRSCIARPRVTMAGVFLPGVALGPPAITGAGI